MQNYIFFCKYTIVQTKSHLVKTKNHLVAEPAGLSYTKPSEVYFGGKKMIITPLLRSVDYFFENLAYVKKML